MTPENKAPEHAPPPPHGHELGFELPPSAILSKKHAVTIGAVALVILLLAFLFGYLPGLHRRTALAEATDLSEKAGLRVEVVTPKVQASDRALSLPGSVQPLEETILYARASGYVRKWYVDIGDNVKDGQLLAEMETP
jgi:membrane fusion protein (multidrug efflux system)